jgi:protein phosphatase
VSAPPGPRYDVVGDVHGCLDALLRLVDALGYREDGTHPEGRALVFVGDLVDRGPDSLGVLRWVRARVEAGLAFAVLGNHDDKLRRHLLGRTVQRGHGLAETIAQIEAESTEGERAQILAFLEALPLRLWLADGALLVCHAGLAERFHRAPDRARIRAFCLYGDVDGRVDAEGFPIRRDWAASYRGAPDVIHGHVPLQEVDIRKNGGGTVVNVDTGCCFGRALTAWRWPEGASVAVPADAVDDLDARAPQPAPTA